MRHDAEDGYDFDDEHDEPQSNLPTSHQPELPQLFRDLGFEDVSTKDTFTIKYSDGTLKVALKRKDGVSQAVHRNVSAGFRAMTEFDPAEMAGKDERNAEIRKRYKKGAHPARIDRTLRLFAGDD